MKYCIVRRLFANTLEINCLTTTIFKKNDKSACIACDSRVSWVSNETGLPIKWFDSLDYCKAITLDGVMYGFAGTNVMYKLFLKHYKGLNTSEFVLDTVVALSKKERVQFFIIRFDGVNLKLFAYSPENEQSPEIFRISKDPAIDKKMYAIGSGKFSKEFKRYRLDKNAQVPIRKIILANSVGLKKAGMLDLDAKIAIGTLTPDESRKAYAACFNKGGDLFTGGEVKMSQNATQQDIDRQVAILDNMDSQAKANGAVCASPVNANLEVKQLRSINQNAVSKYEIDQSLERDNLLAKMQATFNASV